MLPWYLQKQINDHVMTNDLARMGKGYDGFGNHASGYSGYGQSSIGKGYKGEGKSHSKGTQI